MKERLKSNLGLKILSVFLGFFVWLLVVNVSDPKQSGERTVQLEIINDDVLTGAGLTYELAEKSSVTIDYTVHMRDSSQIQASDFRAYIDLADCNVLGAVPVRLEILNNKDRVTDRSQPQRSSCGDRASSEEGISAESRHEGRSRKGI